LPRPHLQLAGTQRALDVDACRREPLEMFLPQLGVHDVESSLSSVEPILDERAKDPVLLVEAVEEGAQVTLTSQDAPCKTHGTTVRPHRRPPFRIALASQSP